MTLLMILILSVKAGAQTINGKVVDAADGRGLPGAVVKLVDVNGNMIVYCLTGREGAFSLNSTDMAESLSVELMGYASKTFSRPFDERYEVVLEPRVEVIQEAVVSASKVVAAGDTLRYNVNALRTNEDNFLSEVLSRIPGLDMDSNGYLRYNGRQINAFYVDGNDVSGPGYNFITTSMSAISVKEVEILQNHQPIRMLQGIRESDRTAINIILNDDARSRMNYRLNAGLSSSFQKPRLSGKAAMYAIKNGAPFISTNIVRFDDQGELLGAFNSEFDDGQSPLRSDIENAITIGHETGLFGRSRSAFNTTWEGATVNRLNISNNGSLGIVVKAVSDALDSWAEKQTTFFGHPNNLELLRTESSSFLSRNINTQLSYKDNAPGHYYNDALTMSVSSNTGLVCVLGNAEQNILSASHKWNIENSATYNKLISGRVLSLESLTQFCGLNEAMTISENLINESIKRRLLSQYFLVSGLSGSVGKWRMTITPQVDIKAFFRENYLSGFSAPGLSIPCDGRSKTMMIGSGLSAGALYNDGPWRLKFIGAAGYSHYSINNNNRGTALAELSGSLKYTSGKWDIAAGGGYKHGGPDVMLFGDAVILSDYFTLTRGMAGFSATTAVNGFIVYTFRAPVSGSLFRLSSHYTLNKFYSTKRELFDDYVLIYLYDELTPIRTNTVSMDYSKAFFRINGCIKATMRHNWISSTIIQNGEVVNYNVNTFVPQLSFDLSPWRWLNIQADAQAQLGTYSAEKFSTLWNHMMNATLKITVKPEEHFNTGLSLDYYYYSNFQKTTLFPDIFLLWRTDNGLRISLEAANILNVQQFEYTLLSPLSEESYTAILRPFTIKAGVEWWF